MKKLLLALSILFFADISTFAQVPQGINYQGVARDNQGNAYSIVNVSVRITFLQSSTPVYQENQTVTTDTFGLYNIVIGSPSAVVTQGTFASIPWSAGNLMVQVDIDPLGGSAYTTVSTMNLQSVPYALYAQSAGNSGTGTVTNVTASPPLSVLNSTSTPTISIAQANAGTDGYLASSDWSTFNNKVSSIVVGPGLTSSPSSTITTTGGIDLPTFTGVAGSWGSTSSYPTFTLDAYGRITSVSTQTISAGNIVLPGTGLTSAISGNTVTLNAMNSSPTWNADKLQNTPISVTAPLTNDILQYNGSAWTPSPFSGLPGGTNGQMLFNNAGVWTPTNTSNLFFNGTNLGLGTTTPGANLDATSTTTSPAIRATAGSGPAIVSNGPLQMNGPLMDVASNPGNSGDVLMSQGPGVAPKWLAFSGGGFWTQSADTLTPTNAAARIAIGTTSPAAKLHAVSSNTFATMYAANSFTAPAAYFQSTGANGDYPALDVVSNNANGYGIRVNNSSGPGILANSPGAYAIAGNISGGSGTGVAGWLRSGTTGGNGIYGLVDNTSSGIAGYFENQNGTNTNPVMQVVNVVGNTGKSAIFSGGSGVQVDQLQITSGATPGSVLTAMDAVGNASWQPAAGGGVTSITVNAPLVNSGTPTAPILNIQPGNGSTDGYISIADWNAFNNKLSAVAVSAPLIGNGTGGAPLQIGLNSGNILVGNASNLAAAAIMTGDASISNTGVATVKGLQGTLVSSVPPAVNQVLQYNGAQWAPGTIATLPSGAANQMLYHNGAAWVVSNTSNLAFTGTNMGVGNSTPNYPLDATSTNTVTTSNFINTGNGRAGNFQVINAASTVTEALNVTNNATGNSRGATFNTSNAGNTASAVHAITAGTGNAITAITTGSGNGVSASTTGVGYSGLFSGGAGLKTDKLTVSSGAAVGSILTANTAAGDAVWSTPSAVVASGGGWSTGGNAASIGNFLGTTNAIPLEIATANATPQSIVFKVGGLATGNEKMRIDANGNVGIGATAPATQLHVLASNPEIRVESTGGAFSSGFGIKTATQQWFIGQENGAPQILRIRDVTSNAVRMEIEKSNGNVGINKTTPTSQLDVASTSTVTTISGINTGSAGSGGVFQISNLNNTAAALDVQTDGGGSAGKFQVLFGNGVSTVPALDVSNVQKGGAASFVINNTTNTADAVSVSTNGSGYALSAINGNTTSGGAGFFKISQAGNSQTVINASTNGTGTVGSFGNTTAATADVVSVNNQGTGNGVRITNGNGGNALFAQSSASNTSPVVAALANASNGFSGSFTGGAGFKTDGLTAAVRVYPGGAAVTLTGTDFFVLVTGSGAINLPAANASNVGKIYIIKNLSAASLPIGGATYTSAGGATNQGAVPSNTVISIISDGSTWQAW